ncbi:hypothetical protein SRS16CHR_00051 [Variovorax sp. SRS16]|uniref:hypothetical protein n=1 Tax=Variovorax sp. SRS16 TaxID=282217 RepID=UPI0013179275|nr:hypothetical protein [Variovorax sp. SRS16]VTU12812.1 hypothetical protein SRS16CHR_00051 [Variovorax sp. SRS16]
MQPILDIQTVQPDLFTYSLGAAKPPGRHCGDFFASAECCLRDAGDALHMYFDSVQIRFAGFTLGSYPVARMMNDPPGLFAELMADLLAIYRQRAAPRHGARRTAPQLRERPSSA